MITWTTAPRADGATLHAADLGDYRIEIIEAATSARWAACKRIQGPDARVVTFAEHSAPVVTVAQRAAVDAVIDDIMGETRRLTTLSEELDAWREEAPDGTQADL